MRLGQRAADVTHDDAVGRPGARRSAIGDVDARCRSEVAAGTGDTVNHRPALNRVDRARLGDRPSYRPLARPGLAAIGRLGQQLERLPSGRGHGPDTKHVGVPATVRADGAAVRWIALAVVGRRADLPLCPSVAAVVRNRHLKRCGSGVAFLLTENAPSRRTRCRRTGSMSALSAQTCSLSENVVVDCWDTTPARIQALLVLFAAAACDVVGAGDGDRLEALEAWSARSGSSTSGWRSTAGSRWPRRSRRGRASARRRRQDRRLKQAVLEVPRQTCRSGRRSGWQGGSAVSGRALAAAGAPRRCTSAGSNCGRCRRRSRPGYADSGRERTGVVRRRRCRPPCRSLRWTPAASTFGCRLVDRDRRLVLFVLRERPRRAPYCHQCLARGLRGGDSR